MRQTNPNCGTTSDNPPGWEQQVRVTKQQLRLGHVQFARPKASKWRPGDSMEHKRGGQEQSAHKYCTFTPTTSYLERMVQRPGILEKSFTVTATRDQCHSAPARLLLQHNLSCIFLMLTLFWLLILNMDSTNSVSYLPSSPKIPFPIKLLSVSTTCNHRPLKEW